MTLERGKIAKWGFGMAPISRRMRERYDNAIQHLADLVGGSLSMQELVPELISEAKGMVNRCIREDQWDWFTVYTEFGLPQRKNLTQIASYLVALRRAAIDKDDGTYSRYVHHLIEADILLILQVYQNQMASQKYSDGAGWIYILSTREQPNILKIGRTDRAVVDRVREINSSTGIVVPWAARCVFRVRNARVCEPEIHRRLEKYRIRMDREFFDLHIGDAVNIIRQYLEESDQYDRMCGEIDWYDRGKGFGFISCAGQPDVYLHRSQLSIQDHDVAEKGMPITFLIGRTPKGPYAADARSVTREQNQLSCR